MSYVFYIINNEHVSTRTDSSSVVDDKSEKYTISSSYFTMSSCDDYLQFQMLRDVDFNNIAPKNSLLEYQIVAIKSGKTNQQNKMLILEHFNRSHEQSDENPHGIKSISTFSINVNSINLDKDNFSTISKQNTIHLELMVHDYNSSYYISNPSFNISSSKLSEILSE